MEQYEISSKPYLKQEVSEGQRNLLEEILSDAKPIVSSSIETNYDLNSRPTELSSGGYVDWCE